MLTEKYDFRITDQMTIPLRPHWIANDSYREKCKMLVLNRSKGEIHKVDFSKLTDYIKEGDVICFNDSTIINHMFICKTRQNRLIKIVIEGFLPNNRVIISGLLKERLNANDVFYLVDNPEISIKIEQRFSEESQYRAVVENHEALICYLASHGERLDEYVDSSLFYKYPDAYRSVFSKKYGSLEIPSAGNVVKLLLWIGMEGGDIHYVIECASCCSQCCFQVFKSKPHLFLKIRLRRSVCVTAYRLTGKRVFPE